MAQRSKAAGKNARASSLWGAKLVILALLAAVGVQLATISARNQSAEAERAALQKQQLALAQENEALRAALERADDPEYLQQLAREEYGMVSPGQRDFYDISN